jgi:hypothetical protein
MAALHGPALWTIAGFVLYVVGWVGSYLVLFALEGVVAPIRDAEAGTLAWSLRNGMHGLVWGALVVAAAAPLGRRFIPGLRFQALGWAILAVGLVLAAVVIALGNEFVRARYGVYDPEYQGLSFFAGPALIAVALATWAALAVPRDGVLAPGAAMLTAAAGLAMALLPSLPGTADGIEPTSVPLAGAFVIGIGYAAVAAVLVVRRLGRPPA